MTLYQTLLFFIVIVSIGVVADSFMETAEEENQE